MESVDDLNARADAVAAIYDQVALLSSEALDGSNVVSGGEPQAATYFAGGVEGSTSECAAVDGIAWSDVNDFDLDDVATHVGLLVGGVVFRTEEIPGGVGPGPVPFVHRVGPGA